MSGGFILFAPFAPAARLSLVFAFAPFAGATRLSAVLCGLSFTTTN
jgi:hypothetical protein